MILQRYDRTKPVLMKYPVLYFPLLFIIACKPVDVKKEKQAIQAQMELVREAHLQKDAQKFYAPNAERWLDVRHGMVEELEIAGIIPSTQLYLDSMEFLELSERQEPIIELSEDGTLASYIGCITVRGMLGDTPVYWPVSWQSVLRKQEGEWKIISTANTEADSRASVGILLSRVRAELGITGERQLHSVYAMAECTGPERAFQTLVMSRDSAGRLEQIYGDGHSVLYHGPATSWSYDVNSQSLNEPLDPEITTSIVAHEMHWLSLLPETRYSDPVYQGIEDFNGQRAFAIEMKNALDRQVRFYYSFETYRPLGFRYQTTDDPGQYLEVVYGNWSAIDGVELFRSATLRHGDEVFTYHFTDIRVNELEEAVDSREALIPTAG